MKVKAAVILVTFFFTWSLGLSSEEMPRFELPVLITSAGQGAEVQIANVLAKRAGLSAMLSKSAAAEDLKDMSSLILVLGVSLKGLGAAGLDMEQEKRRVSRLIEALEASGCKLLCMHLGGEARRGQSSDQMIELCLPHAAAAIVVKSGNTDKLFDVICGQNNIPLIEVDKTVDALQPLKELFQLK